MRLGITVPCRALLSILRKNLGYLIQHCSKHCKEFFGAKLTFIKAVPKVNNDNGNHQLTKHSFSIWMGCFDHSFKSLKIFIGGCHSC